MFHRWYSSNVPVGFSSVSLSFIYSGVPQGEGEAAAPRHSQQRSDASHHHPAALVPGLSDKIALPAKERCHYDHTGIILWIALLECLLGVPENITNIQKDLRTNKEHEGRVNLTGFLLFFFSEVLAWVLWESKPSCHSYPDSMEVFTEEATARGRGWREDVQYPAWTGQVYIQYQSTVTAHNVGTE